MTNNKNRKIAVAAVAAKLAKRIQAEGKSEAEAVQEIERILEDAAAEKKQHQRPKTRRISTKHAQLKP